MALWGKLDDVPSIPVFVQGEPNIFFIDVTEAENPENKAKGINGPGWWRYVTYTDAQNTVRHKAECLVSMAVARADSGDNDSIPAYAITITTQPADVVITGGGPNPAMFSVVATSPIAFAYQWQESTDGGTVFANVVDGGMYSGATTDTLTVSPTNTGLNGYLYRVVLTATVEEADTVTSDEALLTVTA